MIKILQIANKAPYPPNDGSSIAIYNMAEGLCDNNADVHLLVINTKKHFKDDAQVPDYFKSKTHYQSVYADTNTTLIGAFFNLFSSSSYFVSRFYFKDFENKLIEKLKSVQFDIIQLEGLFMGNYISCIRKYSKAKIVLRAHNVEHLIWERHITHEKNVFKKKYLNLQNSRLRNFEFNIFKTVDAIVTITNADKKIIEDQQIKTPIFTCITGVDLKNYELLPNVVKQENTIFYFGSMDWMPNQEAVEWFINNCWEQIRLKNPTCKFIIAGRNMPQKFKTINLPNIQTVENVLDNKEFYSKYDIMLVPLLSGSGLRIKIIEGLSYGKAIVSTTIGAEGIPIQNQKDIIIADSSAEFINAVNLLLTNKDKKHQLEHDAKQFAIMHLGNKHITKELVAFYSGLHA